MTQVHSDSDSDVLSLPYVELTQRVGEADFRRRYLESQSITTLDKRTLWKAMLVSALNDIKRDTNLNKSDLQDELAICVRPSTQENKGGARSLIEYWMRLGQCIVSVPHEIEAMARWFSINGKDREWVSDHLRAASCSNEEIERILSELFFTKPCLTGDPLPLTDHEVGRESKRHEMEQCLRGGATIVVVTGAPLIGKSTAVGRLAKDLMEGYWTTDGNRNYLRGIISLEIRQRDESSERLMNKLYDACLNNLDDPVGLHELLFDYQNDPREKVHELRKALEQDNYLIIVTHIDELLDEEGRIKDAYALFADFLDSCLRSQEKSPRFLVTSTCPLSLGCETVNAVREVKMEGLSTEEGIRLLRFFDPDGRYGLKDEDEQVLGEVVDLALGKPFLLIYFVEQWKKRIETGLDETPQATMEHVKAQKNEQLVDWHYSYLAGPVKCVMDRLAILDAAAPEGLIVHLRPTYYRSEEVEQALSHLVETHLVSVTEPDPHFGREFELDPLFKERIRQKIQEEQPPVFADISKRAAAYYEEQQINVQQWQSAADAKPQMRAFYLYMQAGQYDSAIQLYLELAYSPLAKWGFIETLFDLSDMLHELSENAMGPGRSASLMSRYAHLLSMQGKYDEAVKEFWKAIGQAQAIQDKTTQAFSYMKLAYLMCSHPDLNSADARHTNLSLACEYFKKAEVLTEQLSDGEYDKHMLQFKIFLGLARIYHQQMRIDESIESAYRALEATEHIPKSSRLEFHCLAKIGVIYRLNGDFEKAKEIDQRILQIVDEVNVESARAEVCSRQGHLRRYQGKFLQAREQHELSQFRYQQVGSVSRNVAVQKVYIGNQCLALGDINKAIESYESALDTAKQLRLSQEKSWFTNCLAMAYTMKGAYDRALKMHKKALGASQGWSRVVQKTERAYTNLLKGDDAAAWDDLRKAIQETARLQEQVPAEIFPDLFLSLLYTHDFPDYEMPVPGQYQRQGTILARLYMNQEEWPTALAVIKLVREHTVVPYRHQAAALEGIIRLRLGETAPAQQAFKCACDFAEEMLDANDGQFPDALVTQGLAHCGWALCDVSSETMHIDQAVTTYKQARQYNQVSLDEPLQLLEMLEPLNPKLLARPLNALRSKRLAA